jgi:hypothetical protein
MANSEDRYTVERPNGHLGIYDPHGHKIAEVVGGEREWENAGLIVNGLNMRHRWLMRQKKEE